MKKIVCILLVLVMVLGLTGCAYLDEKYAAKEAEVAAAKVQDMIYNLGNITIDSRIAIEKAEKAYNALNDRAKALVTNYQELVDARATFLKLRRQTIVDRVEATKAAFQESYNARVYFLTLYDTRKDCHEGEFDVVDDDLLKVLEKDGTITTADGKTYTYTEAGKTHKAAFSQPNKAQGEQFGVSAFYVYDFKITGKNNKDASKVWGAVSNVYSKHLALYTMKEKTIDWGLKDDKGKYGIVYADDLGNELQFSLSNTSTEYFYQIMIKYTEK